MRRAIVTFHPLRAAVSAAALAVLAGACGGGGDAAKLPVVPPDAVDLTGQATVEVIVTDNAYSERLIVVSEGTEVVWINEGRNRHNVLAVEGGAFTDVETDQLDDGGRAAVTFDGVGAFPYYCSIHGTPNRGQRGQIFVLPAE